MAAKVQVTGQIISQRPFEAKSGKDAQTLVTIQDGAKFGVFVPSDHLLALADIGQFARVEGLLEVRPGGFLNIFDVGPCTLFDLVKIS